MSVVLSCVVSERGPHVKFYPILPQIHFTWHSSLKWGDFRDLDSWIITVFFSKSFVNYKLLPIKELV